MKNKIDLSGEKYPVQICNNEWYFKGRFIQKQINPKLMPYYSFNDDAEGTDEQTHHSMDEAKKYAREHPNLNPLNKPLNYL